jgi:uncharacterized repeat protein (TIGR03803 family)
MNMQNHRLHLAGLLAAAALLPFSARAEQTLETLVSFSGQNGSNPESIVQGPHGNFYGTTYSGGAGGQGTLFEVPLNAPIKTLISFNGANGAHPESRLVEWTDGNLYGTTYGGGAYNKGTIFQLSPNGAFHTVVSFDGANGANPHSRLGELTEGEFYGTTYNGGANNLGTVFTFSPQTGLHTIVAFNGANGSHPDSALVPWSNGFFYLESLYQNTRDIKASQVQWSGVNFCGTTSTGGAHDNGTIFQVTDAGELTTLVSFSGVNGEELGTIPDSIVPGNDGNLYGTTYYGGPGNHGTIYRLNLKPFPPPGVPPNTATAFGLPAGNSP